MVTAERDNAAPRPVSAREAFPPQASMARRTDVALRAIYPHLVTRIFEVEPHRFVIQFDAVQLDVATIREKFDLHIRPASSFIELSNCAPSKYLREISVIDDTEISRGLEGFSFTFTDIRNILLSKFPNLPIPHGSPNQNNPILFEFEQELTPLQEAQVRSVLAGILPDWPIGFAVVPERAEPDRMSLLDGEQIEVRPARLRPNAPSFVRVDEAFWFDNLDAIFEGRLSTRSIPGLEDAGIACYLDASAFPQIDLRQAVLLYDTVFLTPPLVGNTKLGSDFWERQRVTREDVLTLIEAGRVGLVLRQPEERTDPDFLSAAHERSSRGIIGRLTGAALMAVDVVQTAEEYTFARPDLRLQAGALAKALADEVRLPFDAVTRLLLWPLHARRTCLTALMHRGLMGIAPFSQGAILARELNAVGGRDYELEALATSDGVHIAHALNATLIPPTEEMAGWIPPRQIVGDRLHFYRSFNSRIAAAWAVNERRKEERRRLLPPLPLFEFERHAPIHDLIAATSLASTRRKGRALVSRLAEMAAEERDDEVDRISRELYEVGARRGRLQLASDVGNDAVDVVAAIADFPMLPIKGGWNLLRKCMSLARRIPALDRLSEVVEQDLLERAGKNSDLDFLSRVCRVAKLSECKTS